MLIGFDLGVHTGPFKGIGAMQIAAWLGFIGDAVDMVNQVDPVKNTVLFHAFLLLRVALSPQYAFYALFPAYYVRCTASLGYGNWKMLAQERETWKDLSDGFVERRW